MKYADAAGFRRALEDRLKANADHDGARVARDRKRVAFDRLLARLVVVAPGRWMLKGGFALDLRLAERARTTKDVDLAWLDAEDEVLDTLIDAATTDLGDFFAFEAERAGVPADRLGGTLRFRVAATLAARPFETFALDVGHHGESIEHAEDLTTPKLLEFAGIEPVTVPAIPLAKQIAEKLHAYTRTYEGGRQSSRTKDLVDLALIAQLFEVDAEALRAAIAGTFEVRATHDRPTALPTPPALWRTPFRQLASEVGIALDLNAGHRVAAELIDPILAGGVTAGTWQPAMGTWNPST